jgi:hypothetical protein
MHHRSDHTESRRPNMSLEDLHDIAAKVHEHREELRGIPSPSRMTRLLADLALQLVNEVRNLHERVAELEGAGKM